MKGVVLLETALFCVVSSLQGNGTLPVVKYEHIT